MFRAAGVEKPKATRSRSGAGAPAAKRAKLDASAADTPKETSASSSPLRTIDVVLSLDSRALPKPFKNSSSYSAPKAVKKLKQIAAIEKALDLPVDFPTYWNIEAPPSFKPAKKYCDITGLEAPYTDPKSGLRFHNSDVYQFIRTLEPHHVQSYLSLRDAAVKL
ncbi:chromatin-remodeling complex subunit ies6 [Geranomyces variabilis]|nr:chromatin-remodeling complex subunit ies6 [Geranomyces variabilis]